MKQFARNPWLHMGYICAIILQSGLCVYLSCECFYEDVEIIDLENNEETFVKTSWRPTLIDENRTLERGLDLYKKSPNWYSIHDHSGVDTDVLQSDKSGEYMDDIFIYGNSKKTNFVEIVAEISCFDNVEIFGLVQAVDFDKDAGGREFFYVLFRYIFEIPDFIPFAQPTYGDIFLTVRVGDKKPGLWPWQRMDGGLRLVGSPGKSPPTGYDPVLSFVDFRARYPRRRFDYCTKTPGGKAE